MTSRHRLLTAAHGGTPDRVPVAPYLGNHGARVAGVPIGDYCRSGRIMADAQYRAWELYGQDAVVAQSDNYYIAEGFGVGVDHHEDSTPTLNNMSPVLEDMAATGAHILELDHKVSLREARRRLGPGICLMGNLNPVECLWRGSPSEVATAARDAIAAAGRGAFILGSGCEVPVDAPRENLFGMVAAVRQ